MKLHALTSMVSMISSALHRAEAQPAFAVKGYGAVSAVLYIPALRPGFCAEADKNARSLETPGVFRSKPA